MSNWGSEGRGYHRLQRQPGLYDSLFQIYTQKWVLAINLLRKKQNVCGAAHVRRSEDKQPWGVYSPGFRSWTQAGKAPSNVRETNKQFQGIYLWNLRSQLLAVNGWQEQALSFEAMDAGQPATHVHTDSTNLSQRFINNNGGLLIKQHRMWSWGDRNTWVVLEVVLKGYNQHTWYKYMKFSKS